ncbi:prepilin-type N-terminal cleavage/methylation domain-containing protein [Candidatus Parcubacteria bacterium]|nr:prepilin-type N-terminal cleavage/methylation domain-containing protein [Candidatus Parcubacteria bacterium]
MKHIKRLRAGFTFVELIVSVAIILIISSIVLFQYKEYNNDVTLKGISNEIALALREAQVYATSGREFKPNTNVFKLQYVLLFDKANKSYSLYGDADGDGQVVADQASEILVNYTLRPGYTMDLCMKNTEEGNCINANQTTLFVGFPYKDFQATIKQSDTVPNDPSIKFAEIIIYKIGQTPLQGVSVRIESTGLIEN